MATIEHVSRIGYQSWLTEQFATPPMDTHWAYVVTRRGPPGCVNCESEYVNSVLGSFWRQAIQGPDQLRQRMVFALTELFVESTVNSPISIYKQAHASYLDMLAKNAFGNYRDLIEGVSRQPAMGLYLTYLYNLPEDPITGREPDENYARELMQLFTIGLWQLNEDGTRTKDGNGQDIPAFTQDDVRGLARVMTGFGWGGVPPSRKSWFSANLRWHDQLQIYPEFHEKGEKNLVSGVVIPANTSGNQSLRIALDTLFNHPNVGPFLAQRLIKRFVTSNPSPAYVQRVARAFADNGVGVRGDLKAVLTAVLMDPEARDESKIDDPQWGKLREPVIRYGNFLRAFSAKSNSGMYRIYYVGSAAAGLAQNPLYAPSVFNWFTPDFSPPGEIAASGLVAPEAQILHETSVRGYTRFIIDAAAARTLARKKAAMRYMNSASRRDFIYTDFHDEVLLARRPKLLVERLNLLLTAGQLRDSTSAKIAEAISSLPDNTSERLSTRVSTAVGLIMSSPEYMVQK